MSFFLSRAVSPETYNGKLRKDVNVRRARGKNFHLIFFNFIPARSNKTGKPRANLPLNIVTRFLYKFIQMDHLSGRRMEKQLRFIRQDIKDLQIKN